MHVAQNWRLKSQRYRLQGLKCEKCQQVTFPPREECPHCRETERKAKLVAQIDTAKSEAFVELNAAR
ncbi:MAG: hypothetical protein KF726_12930 [Anaerolineae bacterium]|nr:hypothetical protein [Anaerolineae bacterium]